LIFISIDVTFAGNFIYQRGKNQRIAVQNIEIMQKESKEGNNLLGFFIKNIYI
jgi:hypothetical protein